jgi:hypothetical protein
LELLFFILGIVFVQYCIPLLDGFAAWLLTWIEAKKSKQSELVNQSNINMRQAADAANEPPPHRTIGFTVPENEEKEDDEEDEI